VLFREIIAMYCENHTKHKNTPCGQNAEFYNVKVGGSCSKHCALYGWAVNNDDRWSKLLPTFSIYPIKDVCEWVETFSNNFHHQYIKYQDQQVV
jgi:hypothetical protein